MTLQEIRQQLTEMSRQLDSMIFSLPAKPTDANADFDGQARMALTVEMENVMLQIDALRQQLFDLQA